MTTNKRNNKQQRASEWPPTRRTNVQDKTVTTITNKHHMLNTKYVKKLETVLKIVELG